MRCSTRIHQAGEGSMEDTTGLRNHEQGGGLTEFR